MDYSELVKALRDDNACLSIKTAHEAADAIEELQRHYCRHAIHNEHDRGDDSLCDVLMTEPPRVDPCADCVHYPPSSTDGKPCCACDPANPLTNCHEAKEETE